MPRENILTLEEIDRIATILIANGIDKIRLTGGEPLVRKNLIWLIERLANNTTLKALALTTNGVLLRNQVAILHSAGITHLNISLDSLQRERFLALTGSDDLHTVLAAIDESIATGFQAVKLNVVVIRGFNDDELNAFVELIKNRPIALRFIEFMPFTGNRWQQENVVTADEMISRIARQYTLLPLPTNPSQTTTGADYTISGYAGSIHFIAPVSHSFCRFCNRLRITADGHLKTCLFRSPSLDLRSLLRNGRNDRQIIEAISESLQSKPESSELGMIVTGDIPHCMTAIGG